MQLPILIVLHQGYFDARSGRLLATAARLPARRAPPAIWRLTAADAARSCRRGRFRRPDERQRRRRIHPARDRLDGAVPLKEDKPFLGICLGAQMCARALGARVFPHPEGQAEIGYYPIRPTSAGLAAGQRLAGAGLSVAPRGLRSAALRRASGRRRHVRGAGVPLPANLRTAISSRRDPRHDAPLDDARACPSGNAGRKTARSAFCRPRGLRLQRPRLAWRLLERWIGDRKAA